MKPPIRRKSESGQALVEYSAVLLLMLTLIFGVIEVGRVMLDYVALAEGVRIAARYASVHGYYQQGGSGSASTNCDGTPVDPSLSSSPAVAAIIQNYSALSPITVNVCYSGGNKTGNTVSVSAYYAFTPIASFIPLGSFTLSSTTQSTFVY